MVNAKEIFERVTMRRLTEHILYGTSVSSESEDYDVRLDKAFNVFDNHVKNLAHENANKISDYVNELVRETTEIYTEIGIQSGVLLMMDFMKNTEMAVVSGGEDEMKSSYQEMYYFLFQAVSDVINVLETEDKEQMEHAKMLLKEAQIKAEAICFSTKR